MEVRLKTVIEDVTTSGKSIEETFPIIEAQGDVEILGLMVSLNRMEKGLSSDKCALDEIKEKYGFDANAIVSMDEVVEYLTDKGQLDPEIKDGDRVVIIEDVTTSGKSIEETFPIIKAQGDVEIIGLMVSLNRMEKGLTSDKTAIDEIKEKYGFDANAIVSMDEVVEYLTAEGKLDDELKGRIDEYYKEYGAK